MPEGGGCCCRVFVVVVVFVVDKACRGVCVRVLCGRFVRHDERSVLLVGMLFLI